MAYSYSVDTPDDNSGWVPPTRRVAFNAPFHWLRQGAGAFAAAPGASVGYGLAFTLLAVGLSAVALAQPQLLFTLIAGLLAAGPFLAAALYRVARQQQAAPGQPASATLTYSKGRVAVFVGVMLLLTVAWVRLTGLVFAVYFDQLAPGMALSANPLGGSLSPAFLAVMGVSSGLFALLVFAASALSLPMIVDGKAEAVPALLASLKAVLQQPLTMLLWAGLIVAITAVAAVTIVGLMFVFPWLAYATWHSYRAMVE